MPSLELPPELVLLVVLPPLIYSASVAMSWREFKYNLRPIMLLSVGCVIFTAFAVAAATHYLIGLPWSIGFLLGAIVAPPDVVAPLAIARKLGLPRRILVVLEGEGLANDATALILYRFAVVAISTGAFSLPEAAGTFAAIVVGEVLFGAAVGWLSLRMRHRARDPQVEITLSLITPYVAYWVPEHLGGSGVISTVACGLYMSWNGPLSISSATRLQGIFFWDLVIYLIEGLLFLLTGFQMRSLFEKSKAFSLDDILLATALVTIMVIVARFACGVPAIYLPRLSKRLRERDPSPPWQWAFVIAFTGVRGAVSLAAALALPFALPNGEGFPYRDLILFVSFGVIFITLVGFGLGLPLVVRWLGLAQTARAEHVAEHESEITARREALDAALKSLDAITDDRELSDEVVKLLLARLDISCVTRDICDRPVFLLRRDVSRTSDKAGRHAVATHQDVGQVFCFTRHAGAGTHGVAGLTRKMRRRLALLQRARRIHHQFAEMHDAEIGRAEMLACAVGDRALAVLHRGVLLGDALDPGVAFCLLQLAVDQIVVGLVAQGHIIFVDLGDHAVATVITFPLGLAQRTLRIPGIGVDPATGIGDGYETLAENILARHRTRRIGMHRHQELGDAPVDVVAAGEPAARDRQPGVMRIDPYHRTRVLGEPAHVIGAHARERIDEVLLDIEDFVLFFLEAEMGEGEMRGVDRAFQRLHPVAVLPFLRDVAVRSRHQRHFQVR